jgi:hypothetical protein
MITSATVRKTIDDGDSSNPGHDSTRDLTKKTNFHELILQPHNSTSEEDKFEISPLAIEGENTLLMAAGIFPFSSGHVDSIYLLKDAGTTTLFRIFFQKKLCIVKDFLPGEILCFHVGYPFFINHFKLLGPYLLCQARAPLFPAFFSHIPVQLDYFFVKTSAFSNENDTTKVKDLFDVW